MSVRAPTGVSLPPWCDLCGSPKSEFYSDNGRVRCDGCGAVIYEKPPDGPIPGYE